MFRGKRRELRLKLSLQSVHIVFERRIVKTCRAVPGLPEPAVQRLAVQLHRRLPDEKGEVVIDQRISRGCLFGQGGIVRGHRGLHRKGVGEVKLALVALQRLDHGIQNVLFARAPAGLRRQNGIAGIRRIVGEFGILRRNRDLKEPLLLEEFLDRIAVHVDGSLAQKLMPLKNCDRPRERGAVFQRCLPVVPALDPEHILPVQRIAQILDAYAERALGRRRRNQFLRSRIGNQRGILSVHCRIRVSMTRKKSGPGQITDAKCCRGATQYLLLFPFHLSALADPPSS